MSHYVAQFVDEEDCASHVKANTARIILYEEFSVLLFAPMLILDYTS